MLCTMLCTPSVWSLFPLVLSQSQAIDANPAYCNRALFGSPKPADCLEAANWIPYATQSTVSEARTYRMFAEPRFMGFSEIDNILYRPRAIVQLPKIWKWSA